MIVRRSLAFNGHEFVRATTTVTRSATSRIGSPAHHDPMKCRIVRRGQIGPEQNHSYERVHGVLDQIDNLFVGRQKDAKLSKCGVRFSSVLSHASLDSGMEKAQARGNGPVLAGIEDWRRSWRSIHNSPPLLVSLSATRWTV
jgi:hypothetical protein